jgi:hypothetical protein
LLDQPVDVVIGEAGRDDARLPGISSSGSIVIVTRSSWSETAARQLGGYFAHSRF